MEELTERQKVVRQLQRTVEEWNTADRIANGLCVFCTAETDVAGVCEECEECREACEEAIAEHGQDGAQPLSIDHSVVSRIWVTFGGPNCFIDYNHRTGAAEFFSSYYGDGEAVSLSREEREAIEQLFALDETGEALTDALNNALLGQ